MSEAWSIAGEFMEACSCTFLCPCAPSNASAPATEASCFAPFDWRGAA